MYKKQVAVEDLRIGMYVVELDRPWLGTPFDFQGFPVTSQEEIDLLKRYCKIVFVDPEHAVGARAAQSAGLHARFDGLHRG